MAWRMGPSPRRARYSGSERPAWRMNHTGTLSTGWRRQALRNGERASFAGSTGGMARGYPGVRRAPRGAAGRPSPVTGSGNLAHYTDPFPLSERDPHQDVAANRDLE